MASEFFTEGRGDVGITVTPGVDGILQVWIDGEKIYDKKEEDGQFPTLTRVKEMKAIVREKLAGAPVAADD